MNILLKVYHLQQIYYLTSYIYIILGMAYKSIIFSIDFS